MKSSVFRLNIVVFGLISASLIGFLIVSGNLAFASGGSIAKAYYFPENEGTYGFVDHFLKQTTAVNMNTTVSVSIDGGPPIPMTFQGIKNEIAPGESKALDLYTWQLAIVSITVPGKHTFQFFSHYYVWQDSDGYWAEFSSYSPVYTFCIASRETTPSPSAQSETSNSVPLLASIAVLPLITSLAAVGGVPLKRAISKSKRRR